MSYEIVKKIRIDEEAKKVFITSDSNNVFPKYFKEWECTMLSDILQKEGRQAMEVSILKAYEEGNFQTTTDTKYTRALRALRQMPVYEKSFSWRTSDYADTCPIQANRKSKEFEELLAYALSIEPQSGKFILAKKYFGELIFCTKKTKTRVLWGRDKVMAKVFKYREDVERLKQAFENGNEWEVITL